MKVITKRLQFFILLALFFLNLNTTYCMVMNTIDSFPETMTNIPYPRFPKNPDGTINRQLLLQELNNCVRLCQTDEKDFLVNDMFQKFLQSQRMPYNNKIASIKNSDVLSEHTKELEIQKCKQAVRNKTQRYKFLLTQFFSDALADDEVMYCQGEKPDYKGIYSGQAKMVRIEKKSPQNIIDSTPCLPAVQETFFDQSCDQELIDSEILLPSPNWRRPKHYSVLQPIEMEDGAPQLPEFFTDILNFFKNGFVTIVPDSTIDF
ncbi:MAG TPA: hypothetical protein VLG50_03540 [Candidatus Saccharimonadales bacterium]|nr:hypothetical protein [Candidatus Saccharimonadales bacterium]